MSANARLVVLISGFGSNLQAVLDAAKSGHLSADVVAVVSNKADAYGLERARLANISAIVHPLRKDQTRNEYDRQLAAIVSAYKPDWVILAGWMRILTNSFLENFPGQVINIHPALPGTFPGTHAIERAFEAFQSGQIDHTGVMVHLVPDENIDSGPVLNQQEVKIFPDDTLENLEERIHGVEHQLLVDTLAQVIRKLEKDKNHA